MWIAYTLLLVLTAPFGEPKQRLVINSYASGNVYTVVVTQAALDKAPLWKDDADNPPLPARKAMKLAKGVKDSLVKDDDDVAWVLARTALCDAGSGQWYWHVRYEQHVRQGGMTGIVPTLDLIVLMDGTAIEPSVSKGRR